LAFTNNGGNDGGLPDWAKVHNLIIDFDYSGPSELGKAIMGYRWDLAGYSLEWLYRRATDYDRNKAEEMAAFGANAGCLVWATGFSIENDQFHWDIVRRRIGEFHERGMHVIVYFSLTNAFWMEMFRTVPEAESWRQMGPDGEPVPYGAIHYGGREVTRYLMCVNNPHWREYQKRRIRAAIEAGADGIFWDNNFSKCHCDICREKFRRFTAERLGEAMDIPRPMEGEPPTPEDLRSAREVVFDWVPLSHPQARAHLAKNLFRYLSILDILQELKAYALSLKPEFVWSNNGHLCQQIYDSANVMLSEDLDKPFHDAEKNLLRTNAGVLRYLYEECGRGTPAIVNGQHPEMLAYGCVGYHMRDPELNAFFKANSDLYRDAASPARVGVVVAEMNYINKRSNWFDNLTRNHILYDVIPVHRLGAFDLGLYDVIMLRSILFLSDADCERLRQFVAGGGTLIATNDTSLYDENWAKRSDYGLADVFGISAASTDKPARVEHRFDRGWSVFYPGALELQIESDPNGRPAEAVVQDVKAHLSDPIIEVDAPPAVAVNVMRSAAGLVVHVMNYAEQPVADVRIRLTPGEHLSGTVKRVLPLGDGSAEVKDLSSENGLRFTLERVGTYTAVVIG